MDLLTYVTIITRLHHIELPLVGPVPLPFPFLFAFPLHDLLLPPQVVQLLKIVNYDRYINFLKFFIQRSQCTTSNRQEVKEVNPNIHIIHDIHSNPQETHNNVQELKYSNIQSQEINDIIPHMQTVDDIVTHTLDINDITSFLDTVNAKNDPSVIFI